MNIVTYQIMLYSTACTLALMIIATLIAVALEAWWKDRKGRHNRKDIR